MMYLQQWVNIRLVEYMVAVGRSSESRASSMAVGQVGHSSARGECVVTVGLNRARSN
jgi:hypothetical protein